MKKAVPFTILALVGIGIGAAVYFAFFNEKPIEHVEPEVVEWTFDSAVFLEKFDLNLDGAVDWDEFKATYGSPGAAGENAFLLSNPGKPAASAELAFKRMDSNGNGKIDAEDLKRLTQHVWREFAEKTADRGLIPRDWKGQFLALNSQRAKALSLEDGAVARGELPFAGRYFVGKHFGEWCEVTRKDGSRFAGFLSVSTAEPQPDPESQEKPGKEKFITRQMVLSPHMQVHRIESYHPEVEATVDAAERIHVQEWAAPAEGTMINGLEFPTWGRVFRGGGNSFDYEGFIRHEKGRLLVAQPEPRLTMVPTDATVEKNPQAAYPQYIAAVRSIKFDDIEGNLKLARQCREWGLPLEALNLYMRVLIFSPANAEALDYWGIDVKEDKFHPRKR
jgi:hypothetical protein